jgi:hypothetical protein
VISPDAILGRVSACAKGLFTVEGALVAAALFAEGRRVGVAVVRA